MKEENILNRWLAIKQRKDDLKKEEEKLKKLIDKKLGEDDSLDVGGYRFLREIREVKKYNTKLLRETIKDVDAFNRCLVPENKLVKAILKEQEISKDKINTLNESMEIKSTSQSIKVKKINTKI